MTNREWICESMWIDGAERHAADGAELEVVNPATNEVFATVPAAMEKDVTAAIDAADRAFEGWSHTTAFHRGTLLRRAHDAVLSDAEEIARRMTQEQGKPFAEALGEVKKGAQILRYYAEEGERVFGRIIPNEEGLNIESRVIYQPLGPVGLLSPWNYPVELMAWKVGAALAAGCTFVLKVPSETPLSPLAFVRAMQRAGFPKGVFERCNRKRKRNWACADGKQKVKEDRLYRLNRGWANDNGAECGLAETSIAGTWR